MQSIFADKYVEINASKKKIKRKYLMKKSKI